MKNMFFLLLLISFSSFAQNDKYEDRLLRFSVDSSFGRPVKLPELKRIELYKYFEKGTKSKYGFKVSADSIYRKIFAAYPKDSLPAIDFTKEELWLHFYCSQCIISCPPNFPCHRNACMYQYAWFIRDKRKIKANY